MRLSSQCDHIFEYIHNIPKELRLNLVNMICPFSSFYIFDKVIFFIS